VAIRVLLAVVAVLALAWTGVLLRDEHTGQAASDRLLYGSHLGDRAFDAQLGRLGDAGWLNPDPKWQQQRSGFLLLRGRPEAARRAALDLLRDEPRNLTAWTALLQATNRLDPAGVPAVETQVRRFDPFYGVTPEPRP
jgi:hypothetical protein